MSSGNVTQVFLDDTQYAKQSILQYESVYGTDFVSPGGYEMAAELITQMDLKSESRVLDAGCGLGGSAFVMAREFDLIVHGIDLSTNMLELANAKLQENGLEDRVTLVHGDCLELDRPGHYDGVYSRDVFLHIHDKARLFSVLKSSLVPGGKLLFTDYCCGNKPWSNEFANYVEDRGYMLHTMPEYKNLIVQSGFDQVTCKDLSGRFIEILKGDIERISNLDAEESIREKLARSWREKLARTESGDHRWGLFTAVRPD